MALTSAMVASWPDVVQCILMGLLNCCTGCCWASITRRGQRSRLISPMVQRQGRWENLDFQFRFSILVSVSHLRLQCQSWSMWMRVNVIVINFWFEMLSFIHCILSQVRWLCSCSATHRQMPKRLCHWALDIPLDWIGLDLDDGHSS